MGTLAQNVEGLVNESSLSEDDLVICVNLNVQALQLSKSASRSVPYRSTHTGVQRVLFGAVVFEITLSKCSSTEKQPHKSECVHPMQYSAAIPENEVGLSMT